MDKELKMQDGTISIMDASGHQQLAWGMEDTDAIKAASAAFNALLKRGYVAFAGRPMEPKHRVTSFDSTLGDVVMVPHIIGG